MSRNSASCFFETLVVHRNMHMPIFMVFPSQGNACAGAESLQLRPRPVFLRRLHASLDEGDALDAVLHGRKDYVLARLAALPARRADGPRRLLIDIGEAFEIAFRMARWHAANPAGDRHRAGTVARQKLLGLTER